MKSFLPGLILFMSSFMILSCGNSSSGSASSKKSQEGVEVKITQQMGEMLSDTLSYLPLIGSMAQSRETGEENNQFLVLGKDIEKGDNMSVRKLAKLVYSHGNELQRLVVCIPLDEDYQSVEVKNFEDFATKYGSIKFQLENWYNHFAGLGNCRFIRWEMVNN